MAKKNEAVDPSDIPTSLGAPPRPDDGVMDEPALDEVAQMRADLKKLRLRNAELEAAVGVPEADEDPNAEFVNDKRLSHPHDIERFWRLGKLSPRAVIRFQESGQLPKPQAAE